MSPPVQLLTDIQAWLSSLTGIIPVQINRLEDTPDDVFVVTMLPGGAPFLDGAFETGHFLIRCRSISDDEAERMMAVLHSQILKLSGSFAVGNFWLLYVMSTSGGPSYVGRDVDLRSIYQGSYEYAVAV